jgi:heme exporter protein A
MQLTAENLTCVRGGGEVFRGLGFGLKSGEALLVTGRNGAGKSSLLRMIAGLLCIAEGTLALEGGHQDGTIGEQAHYLGHLDALKPALTVSENLQFWAEFLGPASGDIAPALQAVDLTPLAHLPAAYLSAGQRRRLSLARLVTVPRTIWLLDEPTAALDATSQNKLAGLMRRHLTSGGMIVAAAHGAIGLERARELKMDEQ